MRRRPPSRAETSSCSSHPRALLPLTGCLPVRKLRRIQVRHSERPVKRHTDTDSINRIAAGIHFDGLAGGLLDPPEVEMVVAVDQLLRGAEGGGVVTQI